MSITAAYVGQVLRIKTNVVTNSTYVDPTGITFEVQTPSGTNTTYSSSQITRESLGIYYYDYTIAREGMYYYEWVTTGVGGAANSGQFRGLDTPFD